MIHTYCETCGHCINCNDHPFANKESEKECPGCKWCEYRNDYPVKGEDDEELSPMHPNYKETK